MKMSATVFGCMRLKDDPLGHSASRMLEKIEFCLEHGVTTFDHADIYGDYECESIFGQALKEKPHLRDQMQLVSKCGICLTSEKKPHHTVKHYNYSKQHIISSVETSLTNLNTDHLDLLLLHRPSPLLDPEEVAEAFDQLKTQGKTFHFGVSNFTPSQTRLLRSMIPLAAQQVEVSLIRDEALLDGTVDDSLENNMHVMAWSPLAGGQIAANTHGNQTLESCLLELSAKYKCSVASLGYAWIFSHPAKIHVVTGTNKEERIKECLAAQSLRLETVDWFRIWQARRGQPVP